MGTLKKILNLLHPVLRPLSVWYLSKPRPFSYKGIRIIVNPTVFHPGLFFSTKVILAFLSRRELRNTKILELGAGTGLVSIYSAKKGAIVTATDISNAALRNLTDNAKINGVAMEVAFSDLFSAVSVNDYDLIIINPPYYPRSIDTEKDYAWFCGENFEYFQKLFFQIKRDRKINNEIILILSEDCEIRKIENIALDHQLRFSIIHKQKRMGEWNFIFRIQ